MTPKILRLLITLSVFVTGIMAGVNFDRYTIQVPAWHHLPVESWAAYSRFADLGNGLILYPLEGFGSMLITIAVALGCLIGGKAAKKSLVPASAAAIFAIIGMLFTIFAAPQMLSLRTIGDNHALLQNAFGQFHFWGLLRGISQFIAFIASLWTMSIRTGSDQEAL